jgi:L-asparaginase / beta-aspartyl-peptidase
MHTRQTYGPAIAIHGGAGAVPRLLLESKEKQYRGSLESTLDASYAVLEQGGSSLDAVTTAVRLLEDDPLFNAGRGAALNRDGAAELDAAIMDGRQQRAGAVACVRNVRNPIDLARRVMEKTRHVLLVGAGAEEFALEEGFVPVPNEYFQTEERRQQLEYARQGRRVSELLGSPQGTVGAVALDGAGNLAAATSTGGMTNKRSGRVGDSPIIGAGTYAKNGVCAVSATGHGEYFIRAVAAYHICNAVEYRGLTLEDAAREMLHAVLPSLGGQGGVIAVNASGQVVMDFSSEGMFRGARDSAGRREVGILWIQESSMSGQKPRRLMVIDDNKDAAESMSMLFELWGHEVLCAYDGRAALEAAAKYHPDAVFLDIGLPGMDGYEIAERLRELPESARTVLVAITGYGQDEDRRRSREVGIDHHLVKPVAPETLHKLLDTLGQQ